MSVNKELLPIKAHYFLKNAASAAVIPFIPTIARNLHFPPAALGIIMTAVPVLSLVTKPLVGVLADKFGAHKIFYMFFLIVNMGLAIFINHLPSLPEDNSVIMRCAESTDIIVPTRRSTDECYMKRLRILMENLPLPCQMSCDENQDLINVMNEHKRDWDTQNNTIGFTVGISFPLVKEKDRIHLKLDYINTSKQSWLDPACPNPTEWDCRLACDNSMVHDLVTRDSRIDSSMTAYPQFWAIAVTIIVLRVSSRNLTTMGDTICFKLLGDKPHHIGYQMLWGGVGWGAVAVGTSYVVDMLSEGKPTKDFTYAIYLSVGLILLNAAVGLSFNIKREKTSGALRKKLQLSFISTPSSIFLGWVILCGVLSAFTWNFLIRYIIEVVREDGCSDTTWVKTLNGFTLGVQCFFGEVPFFYLSSWMLNNLGQPTCMSLVLMGFSVRFILYYFLSDPWWILPIEIFNGLTHATFQATMLTYANSIAPKGTGATVQGIVSGVFEGIGVTLGAIIGYLLIDKWGVRQLFLASSLSAAAIAILHITLIIRQTIRSSASLSIHDRKFPPEQFEISDQEDDSR